MAMGVIVNELCIRKPNSSKANRFIFLNLLDSFSVYQFISYVGNENYAVLIIQCVQ